MSFINPIQTPEGLLIRSSRVDDHALSMPGVVVEHTKTNGQYTVIGSGMCEKEWRSLVLYQSHTNGILIARDLRQFTDGRFIMAGQASQGMSGIERHASMIRALLAEWDKFSRYGSPIARSSNETIAAARQLVGGI